MKRNKRNERNERNEKISFWFVVLTFFVMSLTGWLWEVGLHLLSGGGFVNRGFFRGPWLPVYGFGSILILLFHRRLRKNPLLEFMGIILLCGCVEYFASWALEQIYDGKKWWDYSDYALNLNGRICVEGLLAFGVGGMAVIYFFIPFLYRVFQRIPRNRMVLVCLLLMVLFGLDLICSVKEPNTGRGITVASEEERDYAGSLFITDLYSSQCLAAVSYTKLAKGVPRYIPEKERAGRSYFSGNVCGIN